MANNIRPEAVAFANKAREEIKKNIINLISPYSQQIFNPIQNKLAIFQRIKVNSHTALGYIETNINSFQDIDDPSIKHSRIKIELYPKAIHGNDQYYCGDTEETFVTNKNYGGKTTLVANINYLYNKIDQLALKMAYNILDCYTGFDSSKLNNLTLDEYNKYLSIPLPNSISLVPEPIVDNTSSYRPNTGLRKEVKSPQWKNQSGQPISDPFSKTGDDDWFSKLDFNQKSDEQTKAETIKKLIRLANKLDSFGDFEKADAIDQIIRSAL